MLDVVEEIVEEIAAGVDCRLAVVRIRSDYKRLPASISFLTVPLLSILTGFLIYQIAKSTLKEITDVRCNKINESPQAILL